VAASSVIPFDGPAHDHPMLEVRLPSFTRKCPPTANDTAAQRPPFCLGTSVWSPHSNRLRPRAAAAAG
jgi:hypothetical protein